MVMFVWAILAVIWWYVSVAIFYILAWLVSIITGGAYIGDGWIIILALVAGFWPWWTGPVFGTVVAIVKKILGRSD